MKQQLNIHLSQQLNLSPQLMQAIKLLQLSNIELQEIIATTVLNNPMLETQDGENTLEEPSSTDSSDMSQFTPKEEFEGYENTNNIDDEKSIDFKSDDYSAELREGAHFDFTHSSLNPFENLGEQEMDLHSHLLWQLELTPLSEKDKSIGMHIIDEINEDGYLACSLQDIFDALKRNNPQLQDDLELDEIFALLHRIWLFDPIGVGATNLIECLSIQANHLNLDKKTQENVLNIIENHLSLLGSKEFHKLQKMMSLKEDELLECINIIKALNPKPGSVFCSTKTQFIEPDLYVFKENNEWQISLNPNTTPHISINEQYVSLIKKRDNSKDNLYLKEHLQEAKWFIKSLENRHDTLIKVAKSIIKHQARFLEEGPQAMEPLVLSVVAQEIGVHESTVSRITSNKYMHTPRGIFELKQFFPSGVATPHGKSYSSTAISAQIKKLIEGEDKSKPLSDSKLTTLLQERGIPVARRTVAKYREQLGIFPSNERKG